MSSPTQYRMVRLVDVLGNVWWSTIEHSIPLRASAEFLAQRELYGIPTIPVWGGSEQAAWNADWRTRPRKRAESHLALAHVVTMMLPGDPFELAAKKAELSVTG